jgi:periplasmic divalent cation tolerance protein
MPDDLIQIFTTTETREDAERIAGELVDRRLAGCVQIIGPMVSTYRWKGKIEKSQEWLCLIKTKRELFDELEAVVKAIHPYEVPELLAVPVSGASDDYRQWLAGELMSKV